MDKSLVAATSAVGLAITTVPTVALSSEEGSESTIRRKYRTPTWTINRSTASLTTLRSVEHNYKNIECLKTQYGNDGYWTDQLQNGNGEISLTFISKDEEEMKSCLIVEYYKQKYTDGKWWGEFRLVWSIINPKVNIKSGFLLIFNSKTRDGKLSNEAISYVLSGGNNDIWNVWYRQTYSEIVEGDNKFPKPGSAIKTQGDNDIWDFHKDTQKICKLSECRSVPKTDKVEKTTIWEWNKSSSGNKIHDWTENFETWFNSLFSNWSEVSTKLKEITGTWTKK